VPAEQIVQLESELCAAELVAVSTKKVPAGHTEQVNDKVAPTTVE